LPFEAVEHVDEQEKGVQDDDRHGVVKALDLGAVWVPGDQTVDAGGDADVRHQVGRGRLAFVTRGLVLAGVGQVGQHAGHVICAPFSEGTRRDHEGHVVLVDAPAGDRVD
jgi:hypothetical protein